MLGVLARTLAEPRHFTGKIGYPDQIVEQMGLLGGGQTSDFAPNSPRSEERPRGGVAPCPWPLSRHRLREGAVQAAELAY